MECDTKTGGREHGEIVCTVADGNSLGDIDILHLGYEAQELGFASAVDNIAEIASGEFAVNNLKLVGIHVVETILLLKIVPEICESS